MEMILAPSMLSADFAHLEQDLKAAVQPATSYLHVDVMDGHFVPNISFGPPVISCVRDILPEAVLDVHMMVEVELQMIVINMMVEEPARFIQDYKECGADILTVHYEAVKHLHRTIQEIKEAGMKCGVSVNPATPVSVLEEILPMVDMVLIMSVNPGFGGQQLIPETLDKIRKLKEIREEKGLGYDIEIDGGVKLSNLDMVLRAGANVIVAGSAIFSGNIDENVKAFREKMLKA